MRVGVSGKGGGRDEQQRVVVLGAGEGPDLHLYRSPLHARQVALRSAARPVADRDRLVIVISLASPNCQSRFARRFRRDGASPSGNAQRGGGSRQFGFRAGAISKDMNLQVAKVPYRDIMQAPNDLAEGRIQLLMSSYASMRGLIEAGRLKVLAVTSRKRVGIAPEIPTVAEAGFPFLGLDGLIGLFGPRGMPDALREGIAADIASVVAADPTIAARLAATGQVVDVRGPAEFAANIKEQHGKLADIAQALGIKAAQ